MADKTPLNMFFWTFFTIINGYAYYFPINNLQNLQIFHTISQILSSSTHVHFMQNVFSSLTFHRKMLLWKLRDYMIDQRGRQHAATKHGLSRWEVHLSGCKVDHQGISRLENKPDPSSPSPPTFLGAKLNLVLPREVGFLVVLFFFCRFSFTPLKLYE